MIRAAVVCALASEIGDHRRLPVGLRLRHNARSLPNPRACAVRADDESRPDGATIAEFEDAGGGGPAQRLRCRTDHNINIGTPNRTDQGGTKLAFFDDPCERGDRLVFRAEAQLAARVAVHFHPADRRGMRLFGPRAHALEQFLRRGIQCIDARIESCCVGGAFGQRAAIDQRD